MRNGSFNLDDEHSALLKKIMQNEADEKDRQRFNQLHLVRSGGYPADR